MAGDVILLTSRLFPTADQDVVVAATPVAVNQSRVTFTQGKGRMLIQWFVNASSVSVGNVTDVRLTIGGSAPRTVEQIGRVDQLLLNGGSHTIVVSCIVDDPATDSFVEVLAIVLTNSMRLVAVNSVLTVELVPQTVETGPVVRVAA